jgi:hypothetical protein
LKPFQIVICSSYEKKNKNKTQLEEFDGAGWCSHEFEFGTVSQILTKRCCRYTGKEHQSTDNPG